MHVNKVYWSIFLFVAALVLYINTFNAGYVWDDRAAIVGNGDVTGNNRIQDIFQHDFWGQDITSATSHKSYRPMTTLTFRLNHNIHGLNPAGYHVGNVLIYGTCVVLFYLLATRWISNEGSMVASLIFCLHPVHVESVASLVGRADALCGIFMIVAMALYSDSLTCTSADNMSVVVQGYVLLLFSYGCAVGASLSKEIGITIFGVFLMLEVVFLSAQLQEQFFPRKSTSSNSDTASNDYTIIPTKGRLSWLVQADNRSRYISSKQQLRQRRRGFLSGTGKGYPTGAPMHHQIAFIMNEISHAVQVSVKHVLKGWFPYHWNSLMASLWPKTSATSDSLSEDQLSDMDTPNKTTFGSSGDSDDDMVSVSSARSTASSSSQQQSHRTPIVTKTTLFFCAVRVLASLLSLCAILLSRYRLHGDHQLYVWTIMENNVSLMPSFSHRALSYAQTHYFYFLKLFNPLTPHLCFDYGYACLPEIHSLWTPANLLPLLAYGILLYAIGKAVAECRRSLLLSLGILVVTLLPALNILFPVGTLLAERLMFVPSMGASLIVGELLTNDLRIVWQSLADAGYGRDWNTLGLPLSEWKVLLGGKNSGTGSSDIPSTPLSTPHTPRTPNSSLSINSGRSSPCPTTPGSVIESESQDACYCDIAGNVWLQPWMRALSVVLVPVLIVMALRVVIRNQDWQNEIALYGSALNICPDSVKGLNNNGMLQLSLGNAEVALRANERALELYPNQVSAYINGGLANRDLGEYVKSVLKFQNAVRVSQGTSAMAHGYMGSTLYSWYQELAKSAPPPHLHQAVLNVSDDRVWEGVLQEMLRSAAANLDSALALGWTPPAILYSRASIELELMMEKVNGASSVAQEASWDVAISLLQLAIDTNRELRAREAAGAPVQDSINEVVAWNQLGLALWKSGQVLQAEESFLQGINMDPTRYELMVNLGSLYRDNNLLQGAKDMFGRAMNLFRGEGVLPPAALLNNAGLIELDLGNVGLAGDMFARALESLEMDGGKNHPHYGAISANLEKTRGPGKEEIFYEG